MVLNMKVNKIPKPWDYTATCEAVFGIMKPYFTEYDFRITLRGRPDEAFADYRLYEVTVNSPSKGWFSYMKRTIKQEKQVARFTYFPTISNEIDVYINDSDFTEAFKEKLLKVEAYCKNKIVFDVHVQEGK